MAVPTYDHSFSNGSAAKNDSWPLQFPHSHVTDSGTWQLLCIYNSVPLSFYDIFSQLPTSKSIGKPVTSRGHMSYLTTMAMNLLTVMGEKATKLGAVTRHRNNHTT